MNLRLDVRLQDADEAYLGPVAVAQFVDMGWIEPTPMTVTARGRVAIRNGYGAWIGRHQNLPIACEERPDGTACWAGRRAKARGERTIDIKAEEATGS